MSKTHFAVAAAAFGGASDHAAGNGVSASGGAIKWCCCQCISATGAAALIVFQHTCKLPTTLHKVSIHIKDSV